VNRISAWL